MESSSQPTTAPVCTIPPTQFLIIEHPALIRNLDRGIASLGGPEELQRIAKTLHSSAEQPGRDEVGIRLKLRPEDPFQPPIRGTPVRCCDLLLKVEVPRRRRRKRRKVRTVEGEAWEYGEWEECPVEPGTVWDRVCKNEPGVKVEVVGRITHSIRFREMADFQQTTHNSAFLSNMESTLLSGDYKKITSFRISSAHGFNPVGQTDLTRPPQFSAIRIPHIYSYLQNPSVKRAMVDGQPIVLNTQIVPKIYTDMLGVNADEVPTGPPAELPDFDTLDKTGKDTVMLLKQAFEFRPIWSRRALVNHFPDHLVPSVRFCVAYVAYMWRGGPWRDTVTRYGVDPRTDPSFRKYQVVFFQMEDPKDLKEKQQEEDAQPRERDTELVFRQRKSTHLFDGQTLDYIDGRCYQLLDVTDPLLASLISREKIRPKCHEQDGWYCATTLYKIKAVMKKKFRGLLAGLRYPETEFAKIMEAESDEDEEGNFKGKNLNSLKSERRNRSARIKIKTPRTVKGKKGESALENGEAAKEAGGKEAAAGDAGEDEEEENEDDEVNVVEGDIVGESEWRVDTTEQRIRQLMQQMPGMGEDVEMDDADEFELLGDDGDDY